MTILTYDLGMCEGVGRNYHSVSGRFCGELSAILPGIPLDRGGDAHYSQQHTAATNSDTQRNNEARRGGPGLGETDPWGDGSVRGLINADQSPKYRSLPQEKSAKKLG